MKIGRIQELYPVFHMSWREQGKGQENKYSIFNNLVILLLS